MADLQRQPSQIDELRFRGHRTLPLVVTLTASCGQWCRRGQRRSGDDVPNERLGCHNLPGSGNTAGSGAEAADSRPCHRFVGRGHLRCGRPGGRNKVGMHAAPERHGGPSNCGGRSLELIQ